MVPSEQIRPGNQKHIRKFQSLALAVGGEESEVLAALFLCLQQPSAQKNGRFVWNKVSYGFVQKVYLPWLSVRRVRYRFERLVKMGVVKKRYDPREQIPFWAIDHDRLNELERETLTLSVKDPDTECQHPDTEWRQ